MFCGNCGAKLPEGTRFCTVCGTKLASINDSASDSTKFQVDILNSSNNNPDSKASSSTQLSHNNSTSVEKIYGPSSNKSKTKTRTIVVVAIALLAVAIAFIVISNDGFSEIDSKAITACLKKSGYSVEVSCYESWGRDDGNRYRIYGNFWDKKGVSYIFDCTFEKVNGKWHPLSGTCRQGHAVYV